jgi:asparagine synthase (glutamine-hydrolysing)
MDAGTGAPETGCWFVALPDWVSADPVAAALRGRATCKIAHPSGRPWLMGHWPGDAAVVGHAGQVKIALIGQHAVPAAELTTVAGRVRTISDMDRWAASLVGSSHLVASVAGQVRVQGTVTGLRAVCYATIGGATIASNRASVLAEVMDAELDVEQLAVSLLTSSALYPLTGQPVWRGVAAVPTGAYLVLDRDDRHHAVPWWSPPPPVLPMAEGAPALREALAAAVEARVGGKDLISCDLGGLDSTSLCCLAAGGQAKVVAYTADGRDPMTDDAAWARPTIAALGNVEHHVIGGDDLPMPYHGMLDLEERLDEPCAAAMCASRYLFIPRQAAARGSRLHLTGFGGDELLAGSPAHLHTLLRTHPKVALRHARGFAIQRPWSYRETVRQLFDRRPYRAWLAGVVDQLTAPPAPPETPTLDWGTPPRLPPWASADTVEAVRQRIGAAARTVEPLAEGRGQHVELEAMRSTARMVGQLDRLAARTGIELAAPYYDDRVLEAGLAVRPLERITPWQYKPLIVEAMRTVVPQESLVRHTKDEGSYEVDAGMREHRGELLALFEDSRLARLGLVDEHTLRDVCSRPLPPTLQFDALYQTVACEVWLRTLETRPSGVDGEGDDVEAA